MGLKSPLRPAKLTMSVSVTVRPCDSHSCPTSTSSKYRWLAVNDMGLSPGASMGVATLKLSNRRAAAACESSGRQQLRGRNKRFGPTLRAMRVDPDVHQFRFGDL